MNALRVAVIGAGMAGVAALIELRRAGYDDIVAYEKADRIGGTWRENTYPGVACDVPSHLYSYSFAPNPDWSRAFSPGHEICSYLEQVARTHDVERHIRYGAEVTRLTFVDGRWHLEVAEGGTEAYDVVVAATGVLHHPRMPEIVGLETFSGACFHSARWDHSVALEEKRVGIIGTGSTAVQITTAIVDRVTELQLFQRTPQWVLPMANEPVAEADRSRYREHPSTMLELREQLGRSFAENFADVVIDADSPRLELIEQLCRANLEQVEDPELRRKLTPDYRAACKRLIVSPNFYEAVQRPGVDIVTETIERIEPNGVRTSDGRLHAIDVLVLATGFRVDRFLRPIHVIGRNGVSLEEVWSERPSAYLSVSIPQFPNLFLLNGPNGPVGNFSLIDVAELQLGYLLQLVRLLAEGDYREISASTIAAEAFEADRVDAASHTVWVTGCRSWYLDDRGVPAAWPWTFARFREAMTTPRLDHFELH